MKAEIDAMRRLTVINDITQERLRQIDEENWMPEHDDLHCHAELTNGAVCYALAAGSQVTARNAGISDEKHLAELEQPSGLWPWSPDWWKPKDPRRNLIRAAALIVAEIERLDRKAEVQA